MIRKIHSDTNMTIIEWEEDGITHRGKLPFRTDNPTEDMLSLALSYGVVWSEAVYMHVLLPEQITEAIDKNFQNAGIFTMSDLQRADPNMILGLLLKSYRIDYNLFMKHIQNYMEYRNG